MSKPNVVTVSQLRADLPNILHRVVSKRESFTVTKNGLPWAILSPITDPEEEERINREVDEGMRARRCAGGRVGKAGGLYYFQEDT